MNNSETNDFLNRIKVVQDPDKDMLIGIQQRLQLDGISIENVLKLTQNLTENQKNKLKLLYKEQIYSLKQSLLNYKNKIIKIKESSKI